MSSTVIATVDTETTGLINYKDVKNLPYILQLGCVIHCDTNIIDYFDRYVYIGDTVIPQEAFEQHGITNEKCNRLSNGDSIQVVLEAFYDFCVKYKVSHFMCHNVIYDIILLRLTIFRELGKCDFTNKKLIELGQFIANRPCLCSCVNKYITNLSHVTKISECEYVPLFKELEAYYKSTRGGRVKLINLHIKCFNEPFGNAHNAMADVLATIRCYIFNKFEVDLLKINDDFIKLWNRYVLDIKQVEVKKEVINKPYVHPYFTRSKCRSLVPNTF